MSAESERTPIPFEPKKKRQKSSKVNESAPNLPKQPVKSYSPSPSTKAGKNIPKTVSDRMVKRVVAFCGVPTVLGISTLVLNYFLITRFEIKFPPTAILLVNLGFFGLGVLGITYGVLSASWDERTTGTILGWEQFTVNWRRMTAAWQEEKKTKA
ncbi:MAG: PAM68 family protein [Cyanobacteria bacterium P01_A01_bin.45]